jgi:hypothetical protein
VGVEGLEALLRVARTRIVGTCLLQRDFVVAILMQRQRQVNNRVAGALRQIQRQRCIRAAWNGEWRAVLHDSGCHRQGKAPGRQQVAIDRQLSQAPRMRAQRSRSGLQLPSDVPILLLEVLRPEEHAFLPHHLVMPEHSTPLRGWRNLCVATLQAGRARVIQPLSLLTACS